MFRRKRINKVHERERKDSLYRLGFTYYSEYLKSGLWKKLRLIILERDNNCCKFCQEKAEIVHHTSYDYETMSGKNLRHLHSVCSKCHKNGHKKREAVVPKTCARCPNCKQSTLTKEEGMINKWADLSNKVVCKLCRGKAIREYYRSQPKTYYEKPEWSIDEYLSLPEDYKYDLKDYFYGRKT